MVGIWTIVALVLGACDPIQSEPSHAGPKEEIVQQRSWDKLVDVERAAKVPVVLRVRLLRRQGGDKYGWDTVKVVGVIKNESGFRFPDEIAVAHYSAEPGVPDGESTIYLERYDGTNDNLWKLFEGSGVRGVSHGTANGGSAT